MGITYGIKVFHSGPAYPNWLPESRNMLKSRPAANAQANVTSAYPWLP